jgi:membrane fusion protein, macrolide-specific efflux system
MAVEVQTHMTPPVEAPEQRRTSARRAVPRGRRFGAVIVLVVAVALLTATGLYAWRTRFAANSAADRFRTAAVQRGNFEDTVTATGTLQPCDYVDVGTQVSGQLKKLYVEVGSVVKSGALLAEIDPTVYKARVDADRAQLRNLQAQLADKQAQFVLAEQQLTRQQNLTKENATTTDALQIAEATLRSATAQIKALRA